MPFSYTCTDFLRTLLENCIGTVMIEWEQWNFPSPSFDRGYFNSRLKQAMPINELTHKRLIRLFECVFNPENREGRFQEPQAVEAAYLPRSIPVRGRQRLFVGACRNIPRYRLL